MSRTDRQLEDLLTWVRENMPRLRHEPSAVVADRLGDEVLRIDGQLGVEVADDKGADREVIVTAFSDPRLFPLVHRIVHLLSDVPTWRFIALKPPRGFAFTLSVGNQRIHAGSLEFASIPEIQGGIQLIAPVLALDSLPLRQEAEELAWLVVETGIGEELAGRLQHLEFAGVEGTEVRRPIAELEEHVRAMDGVGTWLEEVGKLKTEGDE